MKTLKEFIVEYSTAKGYDFETEEDLFDTFEQCFKVIEDQGRDEHRWYTMIEKVTKCTIDGVDRFFLWDDCEPKDEVASRSDCGWEPPELDSIKEVFPREVTVVKYY